MVLVGIRTLRKLRLDVTNRIVAEITDQPAMKLGQALGFGHAEAIEILFDKPERIVGFLVVHDLVTDLDQRAPAEYLDAGIAGHANNRVTAPLFAALHRFEQVAVRLVGELEISA